MFVMGPYLRAAKTDVCHNNPHPESYECFGIKCHMKTCFESKRDMINAG